VDIVRNLSAIVLDASIGELEAFESLMKSFLESDSIDSGVIEVCTAWNAFDYFPPVFFSFFFVFMLSTGRTSSCQSNVGHVGSFHGKDCWYHGDGHPMCAVAAGDDCQVGYRESRSEILVVV
jgi:hypothetical protein